MEQSGIEMMNRLGPWTMGLLVFLVSLPAAGEQGTVTGTLTLGGSTALLTHAYALARPDSFDKTKENVLVVLADAAIPDEALWEDFPGLKLAAAGKLHAVQVELNADRSVKSAAILDATFVESQAFQGIAEPVFKAATFDGKTVEGKLSSGAPQELANKKFEFTATFRAPVLHRPAPTAAGASAAQTPPARVVLAFLRAAAAGDKAAIRKLLTAEYGKPLDGPNGKAILAAWKAHGLDPATTEISTVDIRGGEAEVVFVDKANGGGMAAKFTLALVGGEWRIDSAMM